MEYGDNCTESRFGEESEANMLSENDIRDKLRSTQLAIEKLEKEFNNGNISKKDYEMSMDLFTTREDILCWVLEM